MDTRFIIENIDKLINAHCYVRTVDSLGCAAYTRDIYKARRFKTLKGVYNSIDKLQKKDILMNLLIY